MRTRVNLDNYKKLPSRDLFFLFVFGVGVLVSAIGLLCAIVSGLGMFFFSTATAALIYGVSFWLIVVGLIVTFISWIFIAVSWRFF